MADKLERVRRFFRLTGAAVRRSDLFWRWVDLGDGTHAPQMEVASGVTLAGTSGVAAGANIITVIPLITAAGVYTPGDSIGGVMTFALGVGARGKIMTVTVADNDQERATMDLEFYSAAPTAADNAPYTPIDAEMANCFLTTSIYKSDFKNHATNAVGSTPALHAPFQADAAGNIYLVAIIREADTYTAVNDLVFTVAIERYL